MLNIINYYYSFSQETTPQKTIHDIKASWLLSLFSYHSPACPHPSLYKGKLELAWNNLSWTLVKRSDPSGSLSEVIGVASPVASFNGLVSRLQTKLKDQCFLYLLSKQTHVTLLRENYGVIIILWMNTFEFF